jgi:predicted SnoaL-like aldol condensation-catalyzing enzyme
MKFIALQTILGAPLLLAVAASARAGGGGGDEGMSSSLQSKGMSGGKGGSMSSTSKRHKKVKTTATTGDEKSKCAELSLIDSCPYHNVVNDVCMTPQMIADALLQALLVDFDVTVAKSLLATDFIPHNPTAPTGAAAILGLVPALKDSGISIEVHRTIVEGNLVAYHSTYTNADLFGAPTLVGFDVFRVEHGQVQEHWDNLQVLQGPNPNGNTMVDGPTMIKYLSQTAANKKHVLGLLDDVLKGGDLDAITDYISADEYTQHNPAIADGIDGLTEGLAALAEQGLTITYDNVPAKLVIAEGNFVLVASLGKLAGNATAYYDLFRVQDGLIVEHWDVIQAIPPAKEFANDNGKF